MAAHLGRCEIGRGMHMGGLCGRARACSDSEVVSWAREAHTSGTGGGGGRAVAPAFDHASSAMGRGGQSAPPS